MLRNLGIRWQILAALALPLLVLMALGGQITYQSVQVMDEARVSLDLSSTATSVSELVGGLSNERQLTVSALSGDDVAAAGLDPVRSANDVRISRIRADIESSGLPWRYRRLLTSSADRHAELAGLRASIDAKTIGVNSAVAQYSAIIGADVGLPGAIAVQLNDRTTAASFARFGALGAAIEARTQEQLAGLMIATAGQATLEQQRRIAAARAVQNQLFAEVNRSASTAEKTAVSRALGQRPAIGDDLEQLRADLATDGTGPVVVDPQKWLAVTQAQITALDALLHSVAASGVTHSKDQLAAARLRAEVTAGGALVLVLIVLLAGMLMARRISQPMRRLTQAATEIRDGLPELVEQVHAGNDLQIEMPDVPIKARRNEVGRLAAAFMDVNQVTVQVAREQAQLRSAISDMFVNVARRNQVLLARQLAFIDQLERNEADPDSLEELFRLDHLATRMRRNAESLLVLAGIESGRRLREPMPLSDVIRTAISEIEHYERVSLALETDPRVYPHLALPVAHLLAELLENATNFSDPASTVVVMAADRGDGIRVTVADHGLGIAEEELADFNAIIEKPPAADVLGSQRLGFFVVGRLAQRLGAQVVLTSGRSGGTTVLIDLPAAMFTESDGAQPEGRFVDPDADAAEESQVALGLVVPEQLDGAGLNDLISLHELDAGDGDLADPRLSAAELLSTVDLDSYEPEWFAPRVEAEPASEATPELQDAAEPAPEMPAAARFFQSRLVPPVTLYSAKPDERDSQEEQAPEPDSAAELPDRSALFSSFFSRREPDVPGDGPAEPAEPADAAEASDRTEAAVPPVVPAPREPSPEVLAEPAPSITPEVQEQLDRSAGHSQEPAPWEKFHSQDVLPQRPAPSIRGGFRLGRRAPAPARPEPPRDGLLGDAPAGTADTTAPPLTRRFRDDGQPRATQWPSTPESPLPSHQDESANQAPAETGNGSAAPAGAHPSAELADPDLAHQTSAYHAQQGQSWPGEQTSVSEPPPLSRRRAESPAESFADLASAASAPLPSRSRIPQPSSEPSDPAQPLATPDSPSARRVPLLGAAALDDADRSHIASAALTELSRLSSYSPAALEPGRDGLQRRTPGAVPDTPDAAAGQANERARSASGVRSMLSGFRAGVERGRTSPSARSRGGPQFRQRDAGEQS